MNSKFLLTPHISNAIGNFADTTNWMLITGDYTAQGGERFLTIGNFEDTTTIDRDTTLENQGLKCHFYIDDVSLTTCAIPQNINDLSSNSAINVYPNPFANTLRIESEKLNQMTINIFDISSKKIMTETFNGNGNLNTSQMKRGFYFYQIKSKGESIKNGKLFKE